MNALPQAGYNKHGRRSGTGGGHKGKTPIVGAVERQGNIVARALTVASQFTLQEFVREAVSNKVSLLATDTHPAYATLEGYPTHKMVKHSAGEYVVGAGHTNTIEGFWSIFKRGVVGTFHKVSCKYMALYVAEFQFRYNHRHNPEIFQAAMRCC